MSAGLRNRRLQVFSFTDASVNGVPATSYAYSNTYWGSLVVTAMKAELVGQQLEHKQTATICLADEATVGFNDLIVDTSTGLAFRVLGGPVARPLAREIELTAISVDDATYTLTGTPQP